MNISTDMKQKIEVIVLGAVSSLIAVFFQPFLQSVWKYFSESSLKFIQHYRDNIYFYASHNNDNSFMLVIIMVIYIALYWYIFVQNNALEVFKEIIKPDSFFNKFLAIVLLILLVIMAIIGAYAIFEITIAEQLNTSFNRKLSAIAPYITDLEEKKLKAMWVTMENKGQYESINLLLEEHARVNLIKLPKE